MKQIELVKSKRTNIQQKLFVSSSDVLLQQEEKELTLALEHWLGLEESWLKQKSREE